LIEAKCQYGRYGRKRASVQPSAVHAARGPPPLFIGQGGGLQSCRIVLNATYGAMTHSVAELMVVLANLAPGGRRGESCTRLGAASRVAT
jgi:hypothetical protein